MSDLKKQIEDAARQYANKTQFMSNYPHDWNSAYDGYIQGAMDVLQPKQANGVDSKPANCAIFDVSDSVCQCKVNRMIVRHEDKDWCNTCGKLVKAN